MSRKKASAIVASRNKSTSDGDKAAPSLSLQKYTQDGKIRLTAELVKELEEALTMCGQTQHKVTLVRRVGPGRPPVKTTSRLSGIQKKVSLPPVHRFIFGRSSKRSLFALERHFLTTLARREGRWECPGFNYACKMTNVNWPYPCPRPFFRTAWRYRTQTLHSIAGAAVQLRVLWVCIRWDDIKASVPPGGTNTITTDLDITTTELLKKRDLPPYGLCSEYLVRKIVVPISLPASQPRGWHCIVFFSLTKAVLRSDSGVLSNFSSNPARQKFYRSKVLLTDLEKCEKSSVSSIFPRKIHGLFKTWKNSLNIFHMHTCLVTLAVCDFVTVMPKKSAT